MLFQKPGRSGRRSRPKPPPHIIPPVLLELQTGVRTSELLNLRWSGVDFQRGHIHLLNPREHATRTKSRKGRSIATTSAARDLLPSIQAEQTSRGIKSEYVFLNVRTGKPYTDVKKGFSAACREAQVADFRFHDTARFLPGFPRRVWGRITIPCLRLSPAYFPF